MITTAMQQDRDRARRSVRMALAHVVLVVLILLAFIWVQTR